MVDFASVSAGFASLKAAKTIISGLSELKIETEILERINLARKEVGEAQDSLYEMRDELFRLQEENRILRQKLTDNESWEKEMLKYNLKRISPSLYVYVNEDDKVNKDLYYCTKCFLDKKISILAAEYVYGDEAKYNCPNCKNAYETSSNTSLGGFRDNAPF